MGSLNLMHVLHYVPQLHVDTQKFHSCPFIQRSSSAIFHSEMFEKRFNSRSVHVTVYTVQLMIPC